MKLLEGVFTLYISTVATVYMFTVNLAKERCKHVAFAWLGFEARETSVLVYRRNSSSLNPFQGCVNFTYIAGLLRELQKSWELTFLDALQGLCASNGNYR